MPQARRVEQASIETFSVLQRKSPEQLPAPADGRFMEKRRRTAAVQDPAEIRSGSANTKRRGCISPLALWNAAIANPNVQGKRADVAAAWQSAANGDGNYNGGFLPKAATPKMDLSRRSAAKAERGAAANGDGLGAHLPLSVFRMPQGQLVALKSHESGCRRTGTLFRLSFWVGRLGQRI